MSGPYQSSTGMYIPLKALNYNRSVLPSSLLFDTTMSDQEESSSVVDESSDREPRVAEVNGGNEVDGAAAGRKRVSSPVLCSSCEY